MGVFFLRSFRVKEVVPKQVEVIEPADVPSSSSPSVTKKSRLDDDDDDSTTLKDDGQI